MSVNACAEIVRKGDPDRFLATMAAPPQARAVLFPIYAANVEIARAPWATEEPLIAEMRLQWWADALDEIASGGPVRKHEVTDALAGVLDADGAAILSRSIEARRRDARREPLARLGDLQSYLSDTGGALMWVATRALGGTGQSRAEAVGTALGLANYLMAVPELLARGRNPLPPMTEAEIAWMLEANIAALAGRAAEKAARLAELSAWRARAVLKRAKADQTAIVDGRLGGSEFTRRAGLLWKSLRA